MVKRLIIVILVSSISSGVSGMKRLREEGALIEHSSKKIKAYDHQPRESLFSLFKTNNLCAFEQEAQWRRYNDKNSLNERDSLGRTILFVVDECQRKKNSKYFNILIENGADINGCNLNTRETVLSNAVIDASFKRMKRALDAGADPNIGFPGFMLPLLYLLRIKATKIYPQKFEIISMFCSKIDVTKMSYCGDNIMHSSFLKSPYAEILLLNGADIDVLNAEGKTPIDTCKCKKTIELLSSRKSVRDQVIMPAMEQVVLKTQSFKNEDNFIHMPSSVSKLVFNRQIIGPKRLNSNNLRYVHR